MARGEGIDVLMANLTVLTGKGISLDLQPNTALQMRWTVWTIDLADQKDQIGAGETIINALKSAYTNTVRDIFKQKEE